MIENVFPQDPSSGTLPSVASAEAQAQPKNCRVAREFSGSAVRRVLIAEDDIALAAFLRAELEEERFTVEVVHDGEHALTALENKNRYNLLILDLNLPTIDGIKLIDRIRPLHPRLPIMVLTARSRVEDKVAAFHAGADDCITKPF